MKSINLLIRIILLLPLVILPAGCGGGGGGGAPGPSLVSLSVTPVNTSITAGGTQQLTATGTFSDGTTRDVSSQSTWTSSPAGVVRISNTGLVSSLGPTGSVSITAAIGTVTSPPVTLTVTAGSTAGANVMAVTVNGSLCSDATSANYFNKPCVSVTICNPGSSTCVTVNDILLDTGSYGLRVFNQALTGLNLTQAPSGTGSLAECIQFADGSSIWGPVKLASVQLGNEPAVQMPIQVIDASFATTPTSCGQPDATPAAAGYTGVLGVGPLAQDCGPNCANTRVGLYFSCTGAVCTGATVGLADQVPNPVARLPVDKNGVQVRLPSVALTGAPTLVGSLLLGIGTQTNNTPAVAPTVLPANQQGEFRATLSGATSSVNSFLDTGSNALFFPSSLPPCTGANFNFYCPPSTTSLTATMVGATGSPSLPVQFTIGNANGLFASNNNVFSDVGGPSTFGFDWGLPFFMGRNVFIGINGTVSPNLGTGPFVAF